MLGSIPMRYKAIKNDEVEDLQRRVAFAETCADPTNFDQLLNRVCSLLNKWAQADVVTLILPPERKGSSRCCTFSVSSRFCRHQNEVSG